MSSLGLLNTVLLILPFLIATYLGIHTWQRRAMPGAVSFMLTMLVVGGWCITAALVVISRTPETARFWLNVMLALIPFLPPCILVTVAYTTNNVRVVAGWLLPLWFIIPTITASLSLSSSFQQFYIYNVQFVQSGRENIGWVNQFGAWSSIHLAYSYGVVLLGIVMLVQQYIRMRFRTYRMRIFLLLIGLTLPFIANAVNTLFMDVRYFVTPIFFNLSTPVLFWALFRYRLFDLLPIAREQAFEHMDDAIIIVDNNNRIVDVNPSAADLAGQKAAQLIEQPLFSAFAPFEAALIPLLKTFPNHYPLEIQAAAQTHYYDVSISPISRDSESVGALIILHNVTEQRLAEARAYRLEMERERVNTLSQFIESASHEFRTPLSIIKNSAFLISRTDDPAKRTDKLGQIDSQVARINQLVDALLNVVRLNAKSELDLKPLAINPLIEQVYKQITSNAAAKQQVITLDLALQLPAINGDAPYLNAALEAIIENAMRYTPVDGTVMITTRQQDSEVIITVHDTGVGIEPDDLPHIFDMFYRVDKAHSTVGFGTGLAIAQRVVALHGGMVEAASTAGTGTVITVHLPASG